MKNLKNKNLLVVLFTFFFMSFAIQEKSSAHCDTMDGPVVKAAQKSLESGNLNYVLIWVQKQHEDEIKKAFEQTQSVRKLNKEAMEMADMYFFETVVRLHRTGEGEPYTGIKPAGTNIGYVIPLADSSFITGNINNLIDFIINAIKQNTTTLFREAVEKRNYDVNNLPAGREYIKSYVEFIHFVESLYDASVKSAAHEENKINH